MIVKFKIGEFTYTRSIDRAKPELIVAPPMRLEFNPQKAPDSDLAFFAWTPSTAALPTTFSRGASSELPAASL